MEELDQRYLLMPAKVNTMLCNCSGEGAGLSLPFLCTLDCSEVNTELVITPGQGLLPGSPLESTA